MRERYDLHPLLRESLEIKVMKFGLDRMLRFDKALGNPSTRFASVQIAGTNGKGSVATKMAKALQANGKRVGLFTSPHISSYRERIQVNGQPIPEERAEEILQKIISLAGELPTYFELLTLVAFCYFAEERVDFAVLETGMGGRLDATNIVKPVLSVITSIDMDHTQFLGETLEAIAFEKGGIIKAGVPALLGPNVKPHYVFETIAERVKSPLFDVAGEFAHYEEENRAIAQKALSLLPFPLEKKSIETGIAAVPPCRFEIISREDPIVIFDVAHNPNGLRRTFERLKQAYPGKRVHIVAGFCGDKAIENSLKVIKKHAKKVYLTHTDHERLLPLGDSCFDTVFEKAYLAAKKNREILLVSGSFFLMEQAYKSASRLGLGKEGGSRSDENK